MANLSMDTRESETAARPRWSPPRMCRPARVLRTSHAISACWVLLCALSLGSGCSKKRGEEARTHYVQILGNLQRGSLSDVYTAALPPSYDQDLNALLAQARALVTKEEFTRFKDVLSRGGAKLAPFLTLVGQSSPALTVLAAKAKDLPGACGVTTYEEFNAVDVQKLLRALDRGLFADLAKADDLRTKLESVQVRVVGESGDWAKLGFTATRGDGFQNEDSLDVLFVEGRWVPAAWAVDWPRVTESIRSEIEQFAAAKQKDPEVLKRSIDALDALLAEPGPLLESVLAQWGAVFGGEPASGAKKDAGR